MATSGFFSVDEDNDVENANENVLSMVYILREMKQKFETLNDKMKKKEKKMTEEITEIRKEMEDNKTQFSKEILELKSELKKNSDKKNGDVALSVLFGKVKTLEEGMKAMGVAQEVKMAEVNGRVGGVTETVSTLVRSLLEAKGTSSADTDELGASKKALWSQWRENEREIQTLKKQLEDQSIEMEKTKQLSKPNNNGLHVGPFDQVNIEMNSFNLVTKNHLFRPSLRWTIDIRQWQRAFELTSREFQWNEYPVQAQAKFQLKEDGFIYLSLCLKGQGTLNDLRPIPQIFYLLKDKHESNSNHACLSQFCLLGEKVNYSSAFDRSLCRMSRLRNSTYNVDSSVEMEIYVEPLSMVHSYDGTLEWTIENYARRLQLEKYGQLSYQESPYFYTGPSGFRVQVGMSLNGDGRGKGPIAYVSFSPGELGTSLSGSFSHCTTVTLVNRKDPERSVVKTIAGCDIQYSSEYEIEMCTFDEVDRLVENDALYCKVVIRSLPGAT